MCSKTSSYFSCSKKRFLTEFIFKNVNRWFLLFENICFNALWYFYLDCDVNTHDCTIAAKEIAKSHAQISRQSIKDTDLKDFITIFIIQLDDTSQWLVDFGNMSWIHVLFECSVISKTMLMIAGLKFIHSSKGKPATS